MAFPGNSYDGHPLAIQLSQVEHVTRKNPEEVFVERSHRGRGVSDSQVFLSGQKRYVRAMLRCAGQIMRIILEKIQDFLRRFRRYCPCV